MELPKRDDLRTPQRESIGITSPILKSNENTFNTPKVLIHDSHSSFNDDDTSLNDDLLSISASNRHRDLSRKSVDSISVRRSFESSIGGRGSRSFGFGNGRHSGSEVYSPLGNNSIYEIVMNTRRKNWLNYPTSYDIPPVVLTKNEIDSEWKADVKKYVDSIKTEYSYFESTNNLKHMNRLEKIKQLEAYNFSNTDLTNTNNNDIDNNNIIENEENISDENYISNKRNASKEFDEVPDFYFKKGFQLDNPRTFHNVLEGLDLKLGKLDAEDESIRNDAFIELRDRLNFYLDAVEGLLVTEISKSSHKFFHTLGNVDQIQEKVSNSINGLVMIVQKLQDVDKNEIQGKIEKLQKIIKQRNIEKLEQGLLQVKQVLIKTEECKKLYEKDEYDSCMGMINSIDDLIRGDNTKNDDVKKWTENWPHKLIDIKSVPSLSETREYLTNMRIEIGGKFSLQLCDILILDLKEYCDSVNSKESLERLQNISRDKKYLVINSELQSSLSVLIDKLFKCEELTSAFSVYQDKAITELKSIIKIYLPQENTSPSDLENSSRPDSGKSSNSGSKLSRLIKEQTPMEFEEMLVKTFTRASEAIRRLYRHQKLLLDISLNEIMSVGQSSRNEHDMITQLDIRNGINESIRIVQLRMGKIIAVRRDLTSQLRFDYFLAVYSICVLFIQECEAVSGEFLTRYLSEVLSAQIKHYIGTKSFRSVRTLKQKISAEKWTPFIVEPSVQKDVNDIVSSMDLDPLDWTKFLEIDPSKYDKKPQDIAEVPEVEVAVSNEPDNLAPKGHRKSVVVADKTFVATDTLISTISMIKETLILSTNLPTSYLPYLEKECYEILKTFCENVTIIVKDPAKGKTNLSIMGESVDCLVEFIKIIQRLFRRLMSSSRDILQKDQQVDYIKLLQMFQSASERIYLANAPPPPA
ncbi:hypothetical protein Kpol_1061p4 [Vanderwaltozyma polyspora DSM 70294]|uniref:Vacuolar protein sorting-associated protein 54 C-terminal domain-containing protein n=1 Tax=Vanderwaltozyma polyspora (strain ATCC 22028 / DSM 70294 / BCRC 21397 / CBS 2163 / NBRC 10782 / NRRL Y-8283 / UCD 57-17) TaxID=436907 RepID=A7TJD2_VANPO|nr:uncharacterized protein Kpol_1061p4 [Vanderwaltozyma polyspora DSM 70294]EDO17582.1 hypothetical protein Kpol_1061p4 [Vanderwaltozyma polyspora DSM 70294]